MEMWDARAKLEQMDRDGIDVAVVSPIGGVSVVDLLRGREADTVARRANEELADFVNSHPGRLVGLATLPLLDGGDTAVAALEHASSVGLRGAMVYSNVGGCSLDDPLFRPLFDAAADLGMPIQIHPTNPLAAAWLQSDALITAVGFLFDTTTAALKLVYAGILADLPQLNLILSHVGSLLPYIIGRIDYQDAMFRTPDALPEKPSEYIRRFYTDSVCGWPPALKLAIDFFGESHVLFGTDTPFWDSATAFDTVAALDMTPTQSDQITWRAASTLFGLHQ